MRKPLKGINEIKNISLSLVHVSQGEINSSFHFARREHHFEISQIRILPYFDASINEVSISIAAVEITVPGPKTPDTPTSYKY